MTSWRLKFRIYAWKWRHKKYSLHILLKMSQNRQNKKFTEPWTTRDRPPVYCLSLITLSVPWLASFAIFWAFLFLLFLVVVIMEKRIFENNDVIIWKIRPRPKIQSRPGSRPSPVTAQLFQNFRKFFQKLKKKIKFLENFPGLDRPRTLAQSIQAK